MENTTPTLSLSVHLKADFDTALARVADALKSEGFGVLTEIDVKDTMKKKLDVDFRPYKILGACNPPLAHRALSAVPQIGLLLPCNVTVSQVDNETIEVGIIDPMMMASVLSHPELDAVAAEARQRLERVIAKLKE